MHNLDLSLSDISKIEGKASCDIKIRHGKVEDVKFSISEFKRFYTRASTESAGLYSRIGFPSAPGSSGWRWK